MPIAHLRGSEYGTLIGGIVIGRGKVKYLGGGGEALPTANHIVCIVLN
jgi:hypothetical protein